MNKLKEYAGLLNEAAPKNHFLAYITEDEKDMLVKAGGKEKPTASGIFSYQPPGRDYSPGGSPNQGPAGGASAGGDYGGNINPSQEYAGHTVQDQRDYRADPEGYVKKHGGDVQPEKTNWFDGVKDFILSGGAIGKAIELTGDVLSKLGEFSSDLQKKAMTMSLNNKITKIGKKDDFHPGAYGYKIQDIQKDLAGIEAGTFTQTDFTEKYGSGDLGGEGEGGDGELMNTFVPYAAHAVGGTEQQPSMVNEYFSSLGNNNLGISSDYTNTYNTAKANIANTLNMTPNTQQYGYNNILNDTYARSMTSANPFFDELTTQGLI